MKKYQALYIFVGITKDDALQVNIEKATAEITRLGGEIIASESLGKRAFSRQLSKRDTGVYVKVTFEIDPLKIAELLKRYRLVEEVFRVQVLAVDERREAKLAAERAARAERQARKEAAAGDSQNVQ